MFLKRRTYYIKNRTLIHKNRPCKLIDVSRTLQSFINYAIKTKKNEKLTKTILCSLRSIFLYIM